jgi:hypothetical protein
MKHIEVICYQQGVQANNAEIYFENVANHLFAFLAICLDERKISRFFHI